MVSFQKKVCTKGHSSTLQVFYFSNVFHDGSIIIHRNYSIKLGSSVRMKPGRRARTSAPTRTGASQTSRATGRCRQASRSRRRSVIGDVVDMRPISSLLSWCISFRRAITLIHFTLFQGKTSRERRAQKRKITKQSSETSSASQFTCSLTKTILRHKNYPKISWFMFTTYGDVSGWFHTIAVSMKHSDDQAFFAFRSSRMGDTRYHSGLL